jgi:putative flippase GtrA
VKRLALRWLKFNLVGALGIGVQLGCLKLLLLSRMNYLAATALAVEIAVLHNFVWHERFTWYERFTRKHRPGRTRERWLRLLRFHLGNGAVSILGNMGLMWLFVGRLHMKQVLVANAIAIAICSFLNFALGEWFVFRP